MIIRTFNYWFIVAPLILAVACLFAVLSVTEENGEAKKRCPDRAWKLCMVLYVVVTGVILAKLFIRESILGMIEFWGGHRTEVTELVSVVTFYLVAAFWSWFVYTASTAARGRYYARVENDCKHGRSKHDLNRRKRAKNNDRRQKKLDIKRKRMIESGKIYVLEPKTTDAAGPNAEQQRAIEYRVNQLLERYDIQEWDNLNCSCNDDSGKHPITEYVSKGVYKYFVAVNLKDESEDPIFLGCDDRKTAKDNLKRYLTEKVEKKILAKKVKPAMNQ